MKIRTILAPVDQKNNKYLCVELDNSLRRLDVYTFFSNGVGVTANVTRKKEPFYIFK